MTQPVFYNRVWETNSGTLNSGAVIQLGIGPKPSYTGYSGTVPNGTPVEITVTDGATFECSQATYSGGQLQRTQIISSNNSGAFFGTQDVFITPLSDWTNNIGSSGWMTSGQLAQNSVNTINVSSGAVTSTKIAAGNVQYVNMAAGAVQGAAGGSTVTIQSGTVGTTDLAPQSVQSGNIASGTVGLVHLNFTPFTLNSGTVQSGNLGNQSVLSGNIGSGQIGSVHLASGTVLGLLTSGIIQQNMLASGVGGGSTFSFTSGCVVSGSLASQVVFSGNIGSGQIGQLHLASGVVQGALLSGNITTNMIGSGQVQGIQIASGNLEWWNCDAGGFTAPAARYIGNFPTGIVVPFTNQPTVLSYVCGEVVSGGCPVAVNPNTNQIVVAMASCSGRWPAIGVAGINQTSGNSVSIIKGGGVWYYGSGQANYSGSYGQPVYLHRSGGVLVLASGGNNSGGFQSGDIIQQVGTAVSGGGVDLWLSPAFGFRASGL